MEVENVILVLVSDDNIFYVCKHSEFDRKSKTWKMKTKETIYVNTRLFKYIQCLKEYVSKKKPWRRESERWVNSR